MYSRRITRRQRGFTLLELMVVMFILVLLAGVVTVVVTKDIEQARHAKAIADIDTLKNGVNKYFLDNNAYPPTLDALRAKPSGEDLANWNGPYIEKPVPKDPWNREYGYQTPGEKNPDAFDLFCLGRDGKEGGEKTDADINNWE